MCPKPLYIFKVHQVYVENFISADMDVHFICGITMKLNAHPFVVKLNSCTVHSFRRKEFLDRPILTILDVLQSLFDRIESIERSVNSQKNPHHLALVTFDCMTTSLVP